MGYKRLIESCNGDTQAAASLLLIEKLTDIVQAQVEAISNMKIDKITVWDSGARDGSGNATANFVSGFIRSLPPLQEIAAMAGIELPEYLGKVVHDGTKTTVTDGLVAEVEHAENLEDQKVVDQD
jgi:flotillin